MIRLEQVSKAYHQGQHNEIWAVRDLCLELKAGQLVLFRGPSGSGKTTLLALIGGLARPTSGRIWLDDQRLSNLPERFLTQVRRNTFGFIFQGFHLIRGLTVLENVLLPAYPEAPDPGVLLDQAMDLLGRFQLQDRAHNRAEWLSGGEAQRTAICRALINDPRVLIADEPTASLDSRLARELLGLIGALTDSGKTVLVSSHDPLVFEAAGVSRVIALRDGRLAGETAC